MIKQNERLKELIKRLKNNLDDFYNTFGVPDILSNSKIFEILIANGLGHILIPGHSGSRDAKDKNDNEFEYKHYKETSSNHTWTFNDFTDTTIEKLNQVKAVIFAHIDDKQKVPKFDWYYSVPGQIISKYLKENTGKIKNARKMVNVSQKQIENGMDIERTVNKNGYESGMYYKWLNEIFQIADEMESITGTKGILTSNKFWEILVSIILGHKVLSEQLGHDAIDGAGNYYEYKIAKNYSWNFQDISDKVLDKYKNDKNIILAVADKVNMEITEIFNADSLKTIKLLKQKLRYKKSLFKSKGKKLRRLQVSLTKGDLKILKAKKIYSL